MSRFYATSFILSALFLSLSACSEGPAATPERPATTPEPMVCAPLVPRVCPCTYGGMGTQQCLAEGGSYGPCEGCPPAPMQSSPDSSPGEDGSGIGTSGDASTSALDASTGSLDASADGSTAETGDGGEPAQLPVGEGVSCGVGLPTLCTLGSERCCVRSLMTDTCIGTSESCECPMQGCETLEANCDGPEDCSDGQVCCGTLSGASYSEFSCADSCNYQGTQRIACHQGQSECPGGQECANSQLLTNLQVCIDPSSISQ